MTALRTVAIASLVGLAAAGCTSFYEIPLETPIQPKLDVTPFQRVHVVGFISGGSDDVDANLETVRLLRSQLRTRSSLRVIEADVLPLAEIAQEQAKESGSKDAPPPTPPPTPPSPSDGSGSGSTESLSNGNGQTQPPQQTPPPAPQGQDQPTSAEALAPRIQNEKDLAAYERLFANVSYWKKLGEEFQQPLIVTGTILFSPQQKSGIVTTQREVYDQFGRRMPVMQRVYMERKGFVLRPKFVFIDGRTGATLYSESFREERLYPAQTNTPALSSYFEMMDTLIPSFLNTLSMQKVRGTRVLLK